MSGMVKYGGIRLAAVHAKLSRKLSKNKPFHGFAKRMSRISELTVTGGVTSGELTEVPA
jgi:hypothetical protein